ncbi:hypothetical protein ACSBR2_026647 [Camellia fascicularis]
MKQKTSRYGILDICLLYYANKHAKRQFLVHLQDEAEAGLECLHQSTKKELQVYLNVDGPLKDSNEFHTKLARLASMRWQQRVRGFLIRIVISLGCNKVVISYSLPVKVCYFLFTCLWIYLYSCSFFFNGNHLALS